MIEYFNYTGADELYLLQDMVVYNNHIAQIFSNSLNSKANILDFGAGIGTITSIVKKKMPNQHIDCLEIDPEQRAILSQKNFKVFSDISEIPENFYTGVFSSNVLEHIEHDVEVLKQLNTKLQSGAKLIFWVPAFMCLWSSLDDRVEHYRRYTRRSLAQTFEAAGFVVEKTYYADSLGFFVALLTKILEKRQSQKQLMTAKTIWFYDRLLFPVSKILDIAVSKILGKNVVIVAHKS